MAGVIQQLPQIKKKPSCGSVVDLKSCYGWGWYIGCGSVGDVQLRPMWHIVCGSVGVVQLGRGRQGGCGSVGDVQLGWFCDKKLVVVGVKEKKS